MSKEYSRMYVSLICQKNHITLVFDSLKSATAFMDAATDALSSVETSLTFSLSNK